MKRMIIAAILALGVHALLLVAEFHWTPQKTFVAPKSGTIKMTLSHRQPDKLKNKSVSKKPFPVTKKRESPVSQPIISKQPTTPKNKFPRRSAVKPLVKPKHTPTLKETSKTSSHSNKDVLYNATEIAPGDIERSSSISTVKKARPLYKKNPPPRYPLVARKRGYQGLVLLDVLVNKNGTVDDIRVSESSGYPILDKKALASVKDWLFEPGKKGGATIKMWVRVPIRFQLQ